MAGAVIGFLLFLLPPQWAVADEPPIEMTMLVGEQSAPGEYSAGVKLDLKDGWKTAWQNPGAAGKPFSLNWRQKRNVASAELFYPAPERFDIAGLWSIGYSERVVFPIKIVAADPSEPSRLAGEVFLIACKNQCIPMRWQVELNLPAPASKQAALIEEYMDLTPKPPNGMRILSAELKRSLLRVTAVREEGPFVSPRLFVRGDDWAESLPPPTRRLEGRVAVFDFPAAEPPLSKSAEFTLKDAERAIYQSVHIIVPAADSFWLIMALALLGGLILNLMPCVLPVLGLKLMGVTNARRGTDKRAGSLKGIRLGFLQGALGIFSSFFLLWAAMFVMKSLGRQVGWGFQFQQPQFLALMALVMVIFAAVMLGKLQLRLPSFIKVRTDSPFSYGVFATLLATPCSAPFVGIAVGYALAAGNAAALAVFMSMSLGFAAPWLAVAAAPSVASGLLPKSGPWMERLKAVLGYLLLASAAWLLWLVHVESGPTAWILAAALAAVFLVRQLRRAWFLVAVAVFCLFIQPKAAMVAADDGRWREFDDKRLTELVAEGQLVFVDVTAKWCITCLLNKRVLNGNAFRQAAAEAVLMRADWTLGDPKITAWMGKYQRRAVPLNIVFGANSEFGIILPEILTEKAVVDALRQASGENKIGENRIGENK